MGATGHLSVKQGTAVVIHLKNGETRAAKFKERRARHVSFYDYPNVPTKYIKTLSIYKRKI